MKECLFHLRNVTKVFQNGEEELKVLDQIDLQVYPHDCIAIVGKSGAGKSTLLNIIAGIDSKYTGEYQFENENIHLKNEKERFQFRKANISYMFQNHHLIPDLNVIQNVEMPLGYQGIPRKKRHAIAMHCLQQVGLQQKWKNKIYTLSGGEQQRVALARAMTISPKVLLADEPTGNLDENTSLQIIERLRSFQQQTTLIIVTHDLTIASQCQRIIHLEKGKNYEKNNN